MLSKRGRWLWVLMGTFILALASISFTVAAEKQAGESKDASEGKAATVNGSVITQADFDREVNSVRQQMVTMGRPITDSQMAQVKKDVLENLIDTELLYQQSQKAGIKIDGSAVDDQINTLKKRFPSETEFENALSKMKITQDELKSQFERGMAIEKLIDEQFIQKITVPDDEVKAYYENNPNLFMQPEQVHARHILITVDKDADESQKAEAHKKIEEVQQKLKEGGDFGELAKEFSQCPSATKGGDLGYFRHGQMVKPFEDAAFSLAPGEVSDIVETQYGYHLISVVDKKPESKVPYDDVKERLGQYLKQEKVQKEVTQYVASLKEEADVKRFLSVEPKAEEIKPEETKKEETKK